LSARAGGLRGLPRSDPAIRATAPPLAWQAERSTDDGSGLARVGVVIGLACLPILLPSAPGNITPADLGLVVATGAVVMWAGMTRQRLRFPFVVGVGVLAIAGALSALFGILPGSGILAVIQDLYLLAWAMALANFGRSPAAAAFLVRAWCVTAAAWAIGLVAFFGRTALTAGIESADSSRAGFTFGDQNAAGLYFVLSLLVMLAARRPHRWCWRAPAIASLLFGMLLTGSLGAISGLLAGLATALVLEVQARRGPDTAIALSLALLLGMGSLALFAERHELVEAAHESRYILIRNSIGRGAQSSSERAVLARQTFHLWRTSGLVGRGPVSTQQTLRNEQAPYPKEAHNDWIAALVERGVVGFVGLLLLVAAIVVRASAIWDPRQLHPQVMAALPAPAYLVGALVTLLVFSLTHEVLHDRTMWALLGLLAAFGLWGRAGRNQEGEQ
jgi:hypothetical protein